MWKIVEAEARKIGVTKTKEGEKKRSNGKEVRRKRRKGKEKENKKKRR